MGYFGGILSSVAQLSMSDLLGNHSLSAATDYMASQEIDNDFNFALSYSYYGQRPTYGVAIFNWSQFYNDANGLYPYRDRQVYGLNRSRQSGLLANLSYPLDVYRRLELSYTFVVEQQELVWPVQQAVLSVSTHLLKTAYVHDSINYGLLGPTSGRRYFLSVGRTLDLSAADRSFSHLELDYRHYLRLGRWSVLGLRANGIGSPGRNGLKYNLGGPAWFLPFYSGFSLNAGPLRGYDWSEFTGSRVVLANAEVRVPFVRNIVFGWPGSFSIPAVDGSFFADVGGAWNKDEELDPWPLHSPYDPPEARGQKQRLRAGVGFGLLVYFGLPLNFEFARQTDLRDFSGYRFHFSFGKSF
jgi:outer membrane protein assembly factor BamA